MFDFGGDPFHRLDSGVFFKDLLALPDRAIFNTWLCNKLSDCLAKNTGHSQ